MGTQPSAEDLTQINGPQVNADAYNKLSSDTTGWQELTASYQEDMQHTAWGSAARMLEMHDAKKQADDLGSKPQSVEDLNRQYPGLPQPFTEATDPFTAGEIARRQTENMHLQDTINSGPQSKLYSAGRFAAGLLAHAGDPIELGLAALTGGATELAGGATAIGAKAGFGLAEKTIAQKFVTGAAAGIAANTAIAPADWIANSQDKTPNSAWGTGANIIMGGLAMGSINASMGVLGKLLNKPQVEMVHNYAVDRLASDKIPDPAPLIKDFVGERSGGTAPDFNPDRPYVFQKLDAESAKGQKFYAPKESVESSITDGGQPRLGGEYGDGLYGTDNPSVANGIAGSKLLDTPGTVHELDLSELKLKSLGADITPEAVEQAKGEGFDGVHYEVHDTAGISHEPYNASLVFDHAVDKVGEPSVSDANVNAVHTPSDQEVTALGKDTLSHESDLHYDPKANEDFQKHLNEPLNDYGQTEYQKAFQNIHDQLKEQLAQHPDTPGLKEGLDSLKNADELGGGIEKMIKGALHCLTRGA